LLFFLLAGGKPFHQWYSVDSYDLSWGVTRNQQRLGPCLVKLGLRWKHRAVVPHTA
jgi:hypothetical protein